jgi:hypothetical protein
MPPFERIADCYHEENLQRKPSPISLKGRWGFRYQPDLTKDCSGMGDGERWTGCTAEQVSWTHANPCKAEGFWGEITCGQLRKIGIGKNEGLR